MAGLLNRGSLRAQSPLSAAVILSPTDSNRLVILLFNFQLLPLFFRLFTQVHLLIDGSVECQYITESASYLIETVGLLRRLLGQITRIHLRKLLQGLMTISRIQFAQKLWEWSRTKSDFTGGLQSENHIKINLFEISRSFHYFVQSLYIFILPLFGDILPVTLKSILWKRWVVPQSTFFAFHITWNCQISSLYVFFLFLSWSYPGFPLLLAR